VAFLGFPVSRRDVYDAIRQACEPCSRLHHAQSPARLKVSDGVRMRRVGAHGSLDRAYSVWAHGCCLSTRGKRAQLCRIFYDIVVFVTTVYPLMGGRATPPPRGGLGRWSFDFQG